MRTRELHGEVGAWFGFVSVAPGGCLGGSKDRNSEEVVAANRLGIAFGDQEMILSVRADTF